MMQSRSNVEKILKEFQIRNGIIDGVEPLIKSIHVSIVAQPVDTTQTCI